MPSDVKIIPRNLIQVEENHLFSILVPFTAIKIAKKERLSILVIEKKDAHAPLQPITS